MYCDTPLYRNNMIPTELIQIAYVAMVPANQSASLLFLEKYDF